MKNTVLILTLTGIVVAIAIAGIAALWAEAGVHLSFHGWVAYALGCIVSLALAAGLFFLTFKSARDGYDDIERLEDLSE